MTPELAMRAVGASLRSEHPALTIEKTDDSTETPRPYRLYSMAELDLLPPARWIIENAIPANGIVGLIGPKGCFKTFCAVDLACHVSLGMPWHGRATERQHVVYVYAEGPFGAKARIDAWCAYQSYATARTIARADLWISLLPSRVPVNNPVQLGALLSEIRRLPDAPGLIIIDTLNANLDGDEDGRGMSGFAAGCAMLRDALGATVIAIHHTPLGTDDRGRGHGAFDGVVDTRLILNRDADRVTLECTHQRNGPDGWSVAFESVPIAGSLTLKPSGLAGGDLKGRRRELLELVHSDGPLSFTSWLRESGLQRSSFDKARTWLKQRAYVTQAQRKYVITDAGRLAIGTPSTPQVHHD